MKKVTVTLPEELVEALGSAAREDGVPLGRKVVSDWQAEHGAFTLEELAAARAETAAARCNWADF